MGLSIFRQSDSNGKVGFWMNGNGTKWMIETDIDESNLCMVTIMAIIHGTYQLIWIPL